MVHKGSLGWAVVLLVFFCSLPCMGQECGNVTSLGLSTCTFLPYDLYYTNITDVDNAEALAAEMMGILANYQQFLSQECYDYLPLFVCNVLHPSCDMTNTSDPQPLLPCASVCSTLLQKCGPNTPLLAPDALKPYTICTDPAIYQQNNQDCSSLVNSTFSYPGACVPFDPALAPNTGEPCSAFAPKMIWLPQNTSGQIKLLDDNANVTAKEIMRSRPIMPINCYKFLLGILCPIIFPPCRTVYVPALDMNISVRGTTICYTLCKQATAECEDFLAATDTPYLHPTCDKPGYSENYYTTPYFHEYITTLTNTTTGLPYNVTVPIPCHDSVFPEDPYQEFSLPNIECPPQTGRKEHVGPYDPMCGLKCPDASYTDAEWRTLVSLTQAGSGISLACMAFLLASYLLKHDKRRFPATTHMHEFFATSFFSISFLLGGSNPEKNVWCYDEGTYATQSNNVTCGVQGFFFIFFGLALAAWCAVIAFTMFYAIVWNTTKDAIRNLQRYNMIYLLFGWGAPLIFAIAAVAAKKIGYGPPLAWCFIQFEGFGHGGGFSKDYPLFYIPIGILFVAILVMFWATVGNIIHIYRNHRMSTENNIFITAQVRVLIFIFVIFAIVFTIFEWRFQIEATNERDNLQQVGIKWTYCKIKIDLGLPFVSEADCPGDNNPARVNYPHTAFESFLLSGIGLLIFIAFGSDLSIYKHWQKILTLLFQRDFGKLKDFVVLGKDPFIVRSNSSTNVPSGQRTPGSVSVQNSKSDLMPKSKSSKGSGSGGSESVEIELA